MSASINSGLFSSSSLQLKNIIVTVHGLFGGGIPLKPLENYLRVVGRSSIVSFRYNAKSQTLKESGSELGQLLKSMKQHTNYDPCCNFITYGYGSLVLREAFRCLNWDDQNSRIVMIAPTNRGHYARMRTLPFCSSYGGIACEELSKLNGKVLDERLGKLPHLCKSLVIAGKLSLNPLCTNKFENDGVVSLKETHLPGHYTHLVMNASHFSLLVYPPTLHITKQFMNYIPEDFES